jgi:hypothetical protein
MKQKVILNQLDRARVRILFATGAISRSQLARLFQCSKTAIARVIAEGERQ